MRVLHVVKTSEGADWAARQVACLVRDGIEVHVALPSLQGRTIELWERSGATLHDAQLDLPVRSPWDLPRVLRRARELVRAVAPDLIHSHFVGTTLALRLALRASSSPIVYQVAGPLHLEHRLFRMAELMSAREQDVWVCSSQFIHALYRAAGVAESRLFVSYYGTDTAAFKTMRSGALRTRLGIEPGALVIGNINYVYPPKFYLGQAVGLKGHELVIDALARLVQQRPGLVGVLLGGQWGGGTAYFGRLKARATALGSGRILMPGPLPPEQVGGAWADFDVSARPSLGELRRSD